LLIRRLRKIANKAKIPQNGLFLLLFGLVLWRGGTYKGVILIWWGKVYAFKRKNKPFPRPKTARRSPAAKK
jgi:hypothetical protein